MKWHYKNNDQVVGPLSGEAIKELHACGMIPEDTPVRQEGSETWMRYGDAFRKETQGATDEIAETEAEIIFHCPHCDQRISASSSDVGASTACPTCGGGIMVGAVSSKSEPPLEAQNTQVLREGAEERVHEEAFKDRVVLPSDNGLLSKLAAPSGVERDPKPVGIGRLAYLTLTIMAVILCGFFIEVFHMQGYPAMFAITIILITTGIYRMRRIGVNPWLSALSFFLVISKYIQHEALMDRDMNLYMKADLIALLALIAPAVCLFWPERRSAMNNKALSNK